MRSDHYEELCRIFIAQKFGLSTDEIHSVSVPNPRRPGLPGFAHQIDLYWELHEPIAQYLNIANAKWRASEKVDQPDVLLLQQVRQDVGAHKAFMLTSVGFTEGALAAGKHHGIALHVVTPAVELESLPVGDRGAARNAMVEMASQSGRPLYSHVAFHRGADPAPVPPAAPRPSVAPTPGVQTSTAPPASVRPSGPSPAAPAHGGTAGASRPFPNFGSGFTKR